MGCIDMSVTLRKISEQSKTEIMQRSVKSFPDRPSESGYTSSAIKKAFYEPVELLINTINNEVVQISQNSINDEMDNVRAFIDEIRINLEQSIANAQQSAEQGLQQGIANAINAIYPVGGLYISTNPNVPTFIEGASWVEWGKGRVPVGVDTSNANFNTVEKQGGDANAVVVEHAHGTTGTNGEHVHRVWGASTGYSANSLGPANSAAKGLASTEHDSVYNERDTFAGSGAAIIRSSGNHSHTVYSAGSAGTDKNLQPYITCYMWKRTA
ncbi:hypothetical protein FACS1894211_12730 [Clostridia bacterium]|nr:hypothetical protein FACS1894211_12730 [Clostridia bacterium]